MEINKKKKRAQSNITDEGAGKDYNIRPAIYSLLNYEPFYGSMSRQIINVENKNIATTQIKWSGKNKRYELHFNPDYMASLRKKCTKEHREMPVLLHDYLHLCFGHTDARANKTGDKMYDEAMDLAVNSHIKPKLTFIQQHDKIPVPGEGKWKNLPTGKSTEFYYELLKEQQSEQGQSPQKQKGDESGDEEGDGESGMDEHDSNSIDGDGLDGELSDAEFERHKILNNAIRAAQSSSKGWGSITMDLQTTIIEMLRARVDWTKIIRAAINGMDKADRASSWRKVNKRMPYMAPGRTHTKFPEVAVSIDQSGSVSDEFLAKFASILNDLSKTVKFTVIPFDTAVDEQNVFVWKKDKKMPLRRTRCGGTDISAPTRWVNERKFELHLVLSDMEAAEPVASKCRRIFIMPAECSMGWATTERVVKMKD